MKCNGDTGNHGVDNLMTGSYQVRKMMVLVAGGAMEVV